MDWLQLVHPNLPKFGLKFAQELHCLHTTIVTPSQLTFILSVIKKEQPYCSDLFLSGPPNLWPYINSILTRLDLVGDITLEVWQELLADVCDSSEDTLVNEVCKDLVSYYR